MVLDGLDCVSQLRVAATQSSGRRRDRRRGKPHNDSTRHNPLRYISATRSPPASSPRSSNARPRRAACSASSGIRQDLLTMAHGHCLGIARPSSPTAWLRSSQDPFSRRSRRARSQQLQSGQDPLRSGVRWYRSEANACAGDDWVLVIPVGRSQAAAY